MTDDIRCAAGQGTSSPGLRLWAALRAMGLYCALWGCVCSMGYLSDLPLLPLLPGGLLCGALTLPERHRGRWTCLGAALAALLFLLRWPSAPEGTKLLLNHLFSASEETQAYIYEKFQVRGSLGDLRYALVPLGLAGGVLCAWSLPSMLLCAGYAGFAAWLGISPGTGWSVALAAALGLRTLAPLSLRRGWVPALAACLTVGLIAGGVLLTVPQAQPGLSDWDERARDVLAADTVAFVEGARVVRPQPQSTPTPSPSPRPLRREADPERADADWSPPVSPRALLVILLFALLLFLPALWSDRLRRRRAQNRAGLEDPDPAAAIRAMFLYGMRWLRLGGLPPENVPYARRRGEIETLFSPALAAAYGAAVPLWQEAAYSAHPMDQTQRAAMENFMNDAVAAARSRMNRRQRLLAKCYYGL